MEVIIEKSVTQSLLQSPSEDWSQCSEYERKCLVCSAPSNGYHFNAPSCSACAAFFRRTVTLNRNFECSHDNNCRINYAMRVICRACRYKKCIEAGMDRRAVQPRRDSIMGRRKIKYNTFTQTKQFNQPQQLKFMNRKFHSFAARSNDDNNFYVFIDSSNHELNSFPNTRSDSFSSASSSASSLNFDGSQNYIFFEQKPPSINNNIYSSTSPSGNSITNNFDNNYISNNSISTVSSSQWNNSDDVLQHLLAEETRTNERRRILYCDRYLSDLLAENSDIAFKLDDLRPLKFMTIRKEIRPMILISFEWLRGWHFFNNLNLADKKLLLRKCVLYHTILDPAYLTLKIGYPDKFIMSNGMYVSISENSNIGWEDEDEIKSATKCMIYKPLMKRVITDIIEPMNKMDLTHQEYCVLKALVPWKSCLSYVTSSTKDILNKEIDSLFLCLNNYYIQQNYDEDTIAERIGNLVLLISNLFDVGIECLENHHKIEFFDLWQLDSLVIKLLKIHK